MGDPIGITYDATSGGPEYTAAEWRQATAALFEGAAGQAYSGVKHNTGLVTLAGTTITHAAHNFVIQGITATTGVYYGYEPQGTKTLTAAHATLNRVDAVWGRVQDHEADASGQRRWIVEYTAGTAGSGSAGVDGITGAPPAPATPYVLLATIAVPANNTPGSVVTDRRTYYNPPPKVEVFTTTGANTWTKLANVKYVVVEVVGGGGGGGGAALTGASQGTCGSGGGGGGYSRKLIQASALGATETVTIGAGGTGGAAGANNGTTGGTTSFGAHCSATGGVLGLGSAAANSSQVSSGVGGVGSGGDLNLAGHDGDHGRVGNAEPVGACGGDSWFGPGARWASSINSAAGNNAAANTGGGGSGGLNRASQSAVAGGNGGSGLVIVTSHFV